MSVSEEVQQGITWATASAVALIVVFSGMHKCATVQAPIDLARIEAYKACVQATQSPERCSGQNGRAP